MDATELVLRARSFLTEEADAVHVTRERLFALIPSAIADLQMEMEANGKPLDAFKQTVAITPVAGIADLSTAIANGLRVDKLRQSDIRVTYAAGTPFQKTVQWVNSYDRLTSRSIQDKNYIFCYLEGNKLYFRDNTIVPAAADPSINFVTSISITTVYRPTVATNIGNELMGDLAKMLAKLGALARPAQNAQSRRFIQKS